MKSISSEGSREQGQRKKQIILGVLLILLMFGSVLGYGLSLISSDNTMQDSNFDGNSWIVDANGAQFNFAHSTNETRQVPIEGSFSGQDYVSKPVYISSKDTAVFQQIASAVSTQAERVQQACYGTCTEDNLPEKTCNDLLIVYEKSETNKIRVQESCVFIEGDSLAIEAFLYKFLGIN